MGSYSLICAKILIIFIGTADIIHISSVLPDFIQKQLKSFFGVAEQVVNILVAVCFNIHSLLRRISDKLVCSTYCQC